MNYELLASGWTSAGNSGPGIGDETSPDSLVKRIETASRAGWKGVGILHSDLAWASQKIGLEKLSIILRDNGIEHVELEFLQSWWEREANQFEWANRLAFLEAAPILGVKTIKICSDLSGSPVDFDTYVTELRDLAHSAAEAGTRVAMEFMPYAHFSDAHEAAQLIDAVDHHAAGLCVDIWHVYRSGMSYDTLVNCLPRGKIFVVELNDAHHEVNGTLTEDSTNDRLYPGEGDFNVPRFIRAMVDSGFDGHWGVEVLSHTHRALPIEVGLQRVHEATLRCLRTAADG